MNIHNFNVTPKRSNFSEKGKDMNIKEYCVKDYGMDDVQVRKELEKYSDMFPHFFDNIKDMETIEDDYQDILSKINEESFRNLKESELVFIKKIISGYTIMIYIMAQQIYEESDKQRFLNSFHELSDIWRIVEFKCNGIILKNSEKDEDKEEKEHEKYLREECDRVMKNFYDSRAEEKYLMFMMDCMEREIDTLSFICSSEFTREEKIIKIEEFLRKMKEVNSGVYKIGNHEIQINECKEIIREYYDEFPAEEDSWKKSLYEDLQQGEINQLLILYNYYRLLKNEKAQGLFFNKVMDHIEMHLADSEKLLAYYQHEIFEEILNNQVKNCLPVEKAIVKSYDKLIVNYELIRKNINDCYQIESLIPEYENQDIREMKHWNNQEAETEGMRLVLKQKQISGADSKTIAKYEKAIQEKYAETQLKYDVESTYRRMQQMMSILFVFIKGVEIYKDSERRSNNFPVNKILRKLRRMDGDLKEILFKDPELYEDYTDHLAAANSSSLAEKEYLAKEERLGEEILDKDIQLAEVDEKEKILELDKKRIAAERDCMRYILMDTVEALEAESIDGLMQRRLSIISDKKLQESDVAVVDALSNRINALFVNKAEQKTDEYEKARKRVEQNVGIERIERLNREICEILTTAELLYSQYIEDKVPIQGFDYSCISAMYYQALEKTYNNIMYTEYARKLNSDNDLLRKIVVEQKNITKRKAKIFLPEVKNNKTVKLTCEYGSFETLLGCLLEKYGQQKESIVSRECITIYKEYLFEKFGWDKECAHNDELPPKIYNKLNTLHKGIEKARSRRNKACHGGEQISYEEAKEDKTYVLPQKGADIAVRECKKLILTIISLY